MSALLASDADPVVEIRGADKVFANGTRALSPVDLTIRGGEFVTLLGPSGCGKSTLLKMIANLIAPSVGSLGWWQSGWAITLASVESLTPGDLERTVTIRAEPFLVVEVLNRLSTQKDANFNHKIPQQPSSSRPPSAWMVAMM
jgi:ABC-type oligopeptide transport system ATPase subunit